ncbi:hypothetical protein GCM10020229_04180 [Kitasatospora albolonga]
MGGELGEDGAVLARFGDPEVGADGEGQHAGGGELPGQGGAFGGAEVEVDRLAGGAAQFDAVPAVLGGQAQDLGDGEAGQGPRGRFDRCELRRPTSSPTHSHTGW